MSSVPTFKRAACNRCRMQKLRCPPSTNGTEACARCTRLRSRCITSFPRPSNNGSRPIQQPHMQPDLRPKETAPPSISPRLTTIDTTSSIAAPIDSQRVQSPSPGRASNSETTSATIFDPLSFTMAEDDFEHFSFSQTTTLSSNDLIFPDGAQTEAATTRLRNDDCILPLTPSAFDGEEISSGDFAGATKEVQRQSNDQVTNEQRHTILDYNVRLSQLNLNLSKRLEQCLPSALCNGNNVLDEIRPETPRTDDGGVGAQEGLPGSKLFEDALGDLSEFLVILQSYTSKKNGHSSEAADGTGQGFISGLSRRISIFVFLSLISAYLQIVVVYDQIFQSLSMRLLENPNGLTGGPQKLPEPRLIGFSLGQSNLQTKIFIHAILHQFDLVERILGLPTELRVTSKPGVYSGLFEDDRARALLGAVSNGNRIENEWCLMHVDGYWLSKALSSLRDTIKKVQASLNT